MATSMDRSLDEILADRERKNSSRGRGGSRRRQRPEYPRDGVRKSLRDEAPRNLDSEWVHDKFEDDGSRRPRRGYQSRDQDEQPGSDRSGAKIRVDNVHYELTKEDLEELFGRIGPVLRLDIRYDRAGRSLGTLFVTYESSEDARKAIREYDGANANGQPIHLQLLRSDSDRRSRNSFDTAAMAGRPLAERVTYPPGRSRSLSPLAEAARKGIDRYVPGSRSRSPLPGRRREGGRRPGARRDGRGRGRGGDDGGERKGRDSRPKKTQEELDAEMEDYFGGGETQTSTAATNGTAQTTNAPAEDDIDMIE